MSLHSYTLFYFRAEQSAYVALNAASLADKQQISIVWSFFPDRGLKPWRA